MLNPAVCCCLFLLLAADSPAPTGRVQVLTVDASTQKQLPARLVLQTSDGEYPGDRLASSATRWPNIEAHGAFIDGAATFDVPTGKTSLTAAHGFQYATASKTFDVVAGETIVVELKLVRLVDMRSKGWVAGDAHVHMIHGEMQRETSYADVATTCAGNGLDFVYVGQEYVGAGKLDLAGMRAECVKVSTSDFRMFLGGERPKSLLGHQAILGVADPFVIAEDPPYFNAARAIHAQGGISFYVHPVRYFPGKQYGGKWLDFPGNNLARELIFDAYCGPSFDGLSVLSDEPANPDAHALWFNLLNRGCFVPVFADSDACFDRPVLGLGAPGFWTTYFHIGAGVEPTDRSLSEAVRRGRTFASTGPLVEFQIDGQISGATLPIDGRPHTVTIQADHPHHAFSLLSKDAKTGEPVGVRRVELIRNGVVVKTWEPKTTSARLEHTVSESQNCWYAVRVFGSDERWQVALASPIYFAKAAVAQKREPASSIVRGRIYDFRSGAERSATVIVRRDDEILKSFTADGQFRVKMPLDAELVVQADGERPLVKNLLLDYGPVHKFMWYLESKDLGKAETFDQFERLVREIDFEFPLGLKLPGCYVASDLPAETAFKSLRVLDGPKPAGDGKVALAALLLDAETIRAGDKIQVAAIFRDEGDPNQVSTLVVEARGYDPARPSGFGALKKFAEFEKKWATAVDLGAGYKMISGSLSVPAWVQAGPTGSIDVSARARKGSQDAAFVGVEIPLGETSRALCVCSGWPTMPISWPDGNYGLGPLKVTGRGGREGQPRADYRQLHLDITTDRGIFDVLPVRDGHGCADADDAVYLDRFLDQTLSVETKLAEPEPVRPQPKIIWRPNIPVMDATKQ